MGAGLSKISKAGLGLDVYKKRPDKLVPSGAVSLELNGAGLTWVSDLI